MAIPAFQQSGQTNDTGGGQVRHESETPAGSEFTTHSTTDLIALRDKLLEECLELESRSGGAKGEGDVADSEPVRTRIDEIHHELALRDLAERVAAGGGPMPAPPSLAGASPAGKALAAGAAQKAFRILDAIEMRSRFMDELAQAARAQGQLDQAATFALNAQKLDMERVEVLRKLSALDAETAGTEE